MNKRPVRIGITDSGYGGLSMVSEFLWRELNLEIVYYGDLQNAPYGNKSKTTVQKHVSDSVDFLLSNDVDIILLACNSATAVAVDYLRDKYPIPIFGMEPAIKPALSEVPGKKIAVLATKLTLEEDKFLSLKNKIDPMNRVIPIPCPGLADLIDQKNWDAAFEYLKNRIYECDLLDVSAFVLGCTHYIYLKEFIRKEFPAIKIFDGNSGTAEHIIRSMNIEKKTIDIDVNRKVKIYFNDVDVTDSESVIYFMNKIEKDIIMKKVV
ncbi:glutamate racemase [Leptospira sp. GIMC2001]|uniref:glutamate racemase n=1 Tax=Leptospira sp. GIMC2001 TaxID=1513297 RepID=UPI00234B89EF|nr:glutamate racemase [Leptospira sp. GIMC2001]WCL50262.1 glutamate racemase [Leptospira sp. GIMC2001]